MSNEEQERINRKVDKIAREGCERIFDSKEPKDRHREIITLLKKYPFITEADLARAEEILEGTERIEDRNTFVEKALLAIKPLSENVRNDPDGFQKREQEEALSGEGKEKLNDLLFYHTEGDSLHLHVLPNNFTSDADKLRLLREGLLRTAEVLAGHPDVKTLFATSWIVAEKPQILEMLGFTIEGEISESERAMIFSEEPRDIWKASISREDFLTKYL